MISNRSIPCPKCRSLNELSSVFCVHCSSEIAVIIEPLDALNNFRLSVLTVDKADLPTIPMIDTNYYQDSTFRSSRSHKRKNPHFSDDTQQFSQAVKKRKSRILTIAIPLIVLIGITITVSFSFRWWVTESASKEENSPRTGVTNGNPAVGTAEVPELAEADVYPVSGVGADGTPYQGFIAVLPFYYSFLPHSTSVIDHLGDIDKQGKDIFTPKFQEMIRNTPEVVVTGTADERLSSKDQNPSTAAENDRASQRGQGLTRVFTDMRQRSGVYAWILGKCKDKTEISYNDQRRIVIIGITQRSKGSDIRDIVRSAVEDVQIQHNNPILRYLQNSYEKSGKYEIF